MRLAMSSPRSEPRSSKCPMVRMACSTAGNSSVARKRVARNSGIRASDRPRTTKSRGVATPRRARVVSRSRSPSSPRILRTDSRTDCCTTSCSTASWRRRIWATSTKGKSSHLRIRRPPMAVTVTSRRSSNDPCRRRSIMVSTSSRCARACSSMMRKSLRWNNSSRDSGKGAASWVART